MPLYETTFITRQDVAANDVNAITESMSGIITGAGGKIVKNEYWGLRSLAYRIKKNRKGHYTHLGIDASAEALKELERRLHLHDDVVRYLTIRVEAISEEPSAPLQKETVREGRGEGRGGHDRGARPNARTN